MVDEVQLDPFAVLGIAKDAKMDEIRSAYRKAALRCHPDLNPGDPKAEARFRQITEAYNVICQSFGQEARLISPEDFARDDVAAGGAVSEKVVDVPKGKDWTIPAGTKAVRYATLNEPVVFILLWALSIGLGLGMFWLLLQMNVLEYFGEQRIWASMGLLLAAPIVTYGVLVALSLLGIYLTRKVVWLITFIGLNKRLLLPWHRVAQLPAEPGAGPSRKA